MSGRKETASPVRKPPPRPQGACSTSGASEERQGGLGFAHQRPPARPGGEVCGGSTDASCGGCRSHGAAPPPGAREALLDRQIACHKTGTYTQAAARRAFPATALLICGESIVPSAPWGCLPFKKMGVEISRSSSCRGRCRW